MMAFMEGSHWMRTPEGDLGGEVSGERGERKGGEWGERKGGYL